MGAPYADSRLGRDRQGAVDIMPVTNAIESLNSTIRSSVRARGHFPSDEAAMKLIWLQLREVTKEWKMPPREWHIAKAQFALLFGDRFEMNH